MAGHKHQSDIAFRLMAWKFKLRDWLRPPLEILRKTGIQSGWTVLDFGCGPGGFSLAAAELVGMKGRVYALDIKPLALKYVQSAAKRKNWGNIQTVDSTAPIPEESVDAVLLYDVLHHLPDSTTILAKLRDVLKNKGILSVSDHHLKEEVLLSLVTEGGFFRFVQKDGYTFRLEKAAAGEVKL